jgi:integrase
LSNTWKVYKTAVDSFQNFRQLYDISQSWPAPLNDILFYIAYLSHTNHSPSTVVTYISGLSHFHKLHNFPDNTQVFVVKKLIEGLKRKRPSQPDVRVPISLDLLKRLITSLRSICTSTYEAALFSSAFSLAFFALLRIGEIASDTNNRPGTHVICFLDFMFKVSDCGHEELHLTLKSSKTDQRLKSVTLIIRRQVDKLICPIESLKRYLSIRSNFPDGNLFIHFDGSNLTRYQFSYILQKSLNFCEEKGLYKPHSFRIGGATEAKRLGFDDHTIMQCHRTHTKNTFVLIFK